MGSPGSDRSEVAHQRGEISIPFSVHNYASNLKCVTEDPLTDEEMATIATLEKGNRLVKGQVFLWHGANDWHDLWMRMALS